MEGFKKYVYKGRSAVPKVAIRKNGQIAFNSGAIAKYDLYAYDYAMVFISERKDRIAIQFTNNEKLDGLIKIQKRPGNFAFSVRTFLSLNDIDWSKTVNYNFEWNAEGKIAIFAP